MIVVDEMLRNVVKWLRMFGVNAIYVKGIKDEKIINMLKKEDILITSDKQLCKRASKLCKCIYLDVRWSLEEKVRTALEQLNHQPNLNMELCSVCGGKLKKVKKEEVKDNLPENVVKYNDEFYMCQKCFKIFWKGSHYKNIQKFFNKIKKGLNLNRKERQL